MGRSRPESSAAPDSGGTLFIVATPIGNLGDMTSRAIETLRGASLVLAEDTRKSRVLLDHFGIRVRLKSAHTHNEASTIPLVLAELARKKNVALVTDAGTPLISDPGSRLVDSVRKAGYRVSPIPGASALTAALSAAGLDTTRFTFFGFLPRGGAERRAAMQAISTLTHTSVIFEAPNRVAKTLRELADGSSGERRCVVARELTKLFEEFRDGTVEELAAYYAESAPRGEVVILLAAAQAKSFSEADLYTRVKVLREAGLTARDAAARVSAETGVSRNMVYRIAVKV
ncbi:MAG TPA: 16S rRNA (cytidine(1402)-2'-O)-methyltransferase [Gemmatimonadaceae bacterium]